MFRTAGIKRLLCTSLLPVVTPHINSNENIPDEEIQKLRPGEIGIDRLKNKFLYNKDGLLSNEAYTIVSTTAMGALAGFILGGFLQTRNTAETFKEENQASAFKNKFDAHKQLQYKYTMDFLRGGRLIGTRIGMFFFIFSTTSTCLYVYRQKYDISNFIAAGAVTGFLLKLNMGFKGAVAGTLFASVLGSIYGIIALLLLYLTNTKMDDLYEGCSSWIKNRENHISKGEYNIKENARRVYNENLMIRETIAVQKMQQKMQQEKEQK